jgi:hypothetical protein
MKIRRIVTGLLLLAFVAVLASSCAKKTCPAYSKLYRSSVINN